MQGASEIRFHKKNELSMQRTCKTSVYKELKRAKQEENETQEVDNTRPLRKGKKCS